MELPKPLLPATLIRRYKRFLADCRLENGTEVTAHCPNPGAMMGLNTPGLPVWLSKSDSKTRKLPHTLELVALPTGLVGINTNLPNKIAEEAVACGVVAELTGYPTIRREVKYGRNSRIDLLLEAPDRPPAFVEIKNVHLRREDGLHPTAAEFPDSVTARGAKHLRELSAEVAAGNRAVMLYVIQRMDCDHFRLADDIDPTYARALDDAMKAGVEAYAYVADITLDAITLARPLPIML